MHRAGVVGDAFRRRRYRRQAGCAGGQRQHAIAVTLCLGLGVHGQHPVAGYGQAQRALVDAVTSVAQIGHLDGAHARHLGHLGHCTYGGVGDHFAREGLQFDTQAVVAGCGRTVGQRDPDAKRTGDSIIGDVCRRALRRLSRPQRVGRRGYKHQCQQNQNLLHLCSPWPWTGRWALAQWRQSAMARARSARPRSRSSSACRRRWWASMTLRKLPRPLR